MTQTQHSGIDDRKPQPQDPQQDPPHAPDTSTPPFPEPEREPVGSDWELEPGVRYLVCLDVDGTLVDHDGRMSQEVLDAARAAAAAGHHLVIATGRSRGATLPVCEKLGLATGYAVSSNGGITMHLSSEHEDYHRVIDAVTFNPGPALDALGKALPAAKYAIETADGSFYSTERFQDRSFGIEAVPTDLQGLAELDAVRLVVYSSQDEPEDFAEAIDRAGLHGVAYSVGWTSWLDVAANGVSKASALEQVRRSLEVDPAHTVAIGDGHNDIEMLDWAARGVAMGQAPDEVVAVAREVTTSVYQDGAARILRSLVPAD
ncbi:HAD family hydrolase [Kocuria palustris]|uniref:HAD family hydrolase n=1 Tax=Kocuria palustris TaxID=71999 RepID=UPI0011A5ABDE|nr:HAD family hydrolase [Kocuria palustris]